MNREIKEVEKLLSEIDKICKREGIPYYLGPQLTLCCITGQEITNPHAGVIYMRTADMERFRLAFEKEPQDGRIVESMNNNKRFYGFFLRYTDLNTLCFRLNEGRNYKYPGMGVDILPLRGKQHFRLAHLWTRAQEVGWNELGDYYGDRRGKKKAFCRMAMRLRLLTGRGRLAKGLYRMLCRRMNVENTQEYVVRLKKKAVYFPVEIFDETRTVEIDGKKFPVPADTDTYLRKYYGADYQQKILPVYTPKVSEMVSARIRYEDYFQEVGNQNRFIKMRIRARKKSGRASRKKKYLNWSWNYVKFCAYKIELEKYYLDKKDYIINLYKNKDYPALENVFKPYTKATTKSLKNNEVFIPDEEIHHIYMDVLNKAGRPKLKARIEKLWK
nr:LicD family protein [uncultured Blautia sp.]